MPLETNRPMVLMNASVELLVGSHEMRYREDIESRFTARHKACIEFTSNVKGRIVLDIGCWIGWYEKFMIKKGCKFIVGIDLDRVALRKAKKSVPPEKCEFVCASANTLPFKSNSFDAIALFDVLEHLPVGSEFSFFSKTSRLLETNGLLIVSVPNDRSVSKLLDPAYFLIGHRHYTLDKIKALMEKAGFNIYKVGYGGGITEALSMVFLYFFKHFFGAEVPLKSFLEHLRGKEYQKKGFETLFVRAVKIGQLKD
jgi:2-polyprenyl-3-methyl-5-hydroxy-6-metoxy-1,4-benzoquinol methylase